ncbi:hypothetical protein D3C75_587470 [compost metagenome]
MLGVNHARAAVTEQRRTPVALVIDLVKGHPVLHFALVAFKHHFGKTNKEIDNFTVSPATVFGHQVVRHFEVGKGNDRLDVVFQQFVEHVVVEFQTFFIRLLLIPFWEDTRPGNRGAEAFEAHFGKQRDVFFITAMEINGFVVWIKFTRDNFLGDFTRYTVRAAGQHITNTWAFTFFVPATFYLMCSYRAAP